MLDQGGGLGFPHPAKLATKILADKEGAHKKREGRGVPAYTRQKADGDDEGNRQVDGEKPLDRQFFNVRSPVPERKVNEDYDAGKVSQVHMWRLV
jgi:hypothetical protein